jgi:hypothetical protein
VSNARLDEGPLLSILEVQTGRIRLEQILICAVPEYKKLVAFIDGLGSMDGLGSL